MKIGINKPFKSHFLRKTNHDQVTGLCQTLILSSIKAISRNTRKFCKSKQSVLVNENTEAVQKAYGKSRYSRCPSNPQKQSQLFSVVPHSPSSDGLRGFTVIVYSNKQHRYTE